MLHKVFENYVLDLVTIMLSDKQEYILFSCRKQEASITGRYFSFEIPEKIPYFLYFNEIVRHSDFYKTFI